MVAAYEAAGVERYAAWVHEGDEGMRAELARRGFTVEESTRAMSLSLGDAPEWTRLAGNVCAILVDHERGTLAAGADARAEAYALGW